MKEMKSATPLSCRFVVLAGCCLLSAGSVVGQTRDQYAAARARMVQREVFEAGVRNQRVCDALRSTPRHLFVLPPQRKYAYYDMALPIGEGQTISPPFIVAYMTEKLDPQPTDRVLEIGTGSGYQAAVLSPLVAEVYSIEIVEALGRRAAATLKNLKYKNVKTKIGDGFQGWPEHAPFDKIIVTCSPEKVPQPLVDQLREGGRIVIPLGERFQQSMCLCTKVNGKLVRENLQATFFVPMTGRAEEVRQIKRDSGRPNLRNGSFEQRNDAGEPTGWYYVRQAKVERKAESPIGKAYLLCKNREAGRSSQALQAVGVDGREVNRLHVSLWVRTSDVVPGQSIEQLPQLRISFFDAQQAPLGSRRLGPWFGTMSWNEKQASIKVPRNARLAVLMLGMFGAVGEAGYDDVTIQAAPRGSGS